MSASDFAHWVKELSRLTGRLDVDCVTEADPRYEAARLVFNRLHDARPGALIRTRSPTAIAQILDFAASRDLPLAVRGGGHHIAGYGSCDAGIVIDFTPFRRVDIDHSTGAVSVQAGARICDVDAALAPLGLVVPTGTVSTTGIAGLTLGGGIGWLIGRYGLTCDQLVGADVVLADGRSVQAEDPGNRDLLWALRGGGGNFGVVTCFRYRTHSLPSCTVGRAVIPFDRASVTLSRTVDFLTSRCPPELTVAPTLKIASEGRPELSVDFCLAGGSESTLRAFVEAVGDAAWDIRPNADYEWWQRSFDHIFQAPLRGYWKARYSSHITADDIAIVLARLTSAPTATCNVLIEHLHGAFGDADHDAAFPMRHATFGVLLSARWRDSHEDRRCISWVRETFSLLDPADASPTYSNYALGDDRRALSTLMRGHSVRLTEAKRRYDPTNLFRRNHNIAIDSLDSAHSTADPKR